MKVLHVCYSDFEGGAARAAYRIHQAQRNNGLNSHMLVINKVSDDPFVHSVGGFLRFKIQAFGVISQKIMKLQKSKNSVAHSLNIFSSGLLKKINQIAPDIINLHWLGGEMLSIKEISRITQPIVWTMHDMWAFCGAEHYEDPQNIGRYEQAYDKKNRSVYDRGLDVNKYIYNYKRKHWKGKKFNIVTPSNWLADCSKRSLLFCNQPVEVISNCIKHSLYRPIDKLIARKLLGLPENKKLILFGAMSSTSDSRKGYSYLIEALQKYDRKEEVELVVFGASRGSSQRDTGITTHYMGRLYDDMSLILLYNAADIFIAPSLQDNLPNTLVESLACGTPCIAFKIGGMPDLVSDNMLGSLAPSINSISLKNSIESSLVQNFSCNEIAYTSKKIRDEKIISSHYEKLYADLI